MKKLCVLDVDDTIIEWDYAGNHISIDVRTGAYELLDYLVDAEIDIALFSTARLQYVQRVRKKYFDYYDFVSLKGSESVTYKDNMKVKDIGIYEHMGYQVPNIVLIDDKSRNARLYPDNFIKVQTPSVYNKSGKFDNELFKVINKIDMFFNR